MIRKKTLDSIIFKKLKKLERRIRKLEKEINEIKKSKINEEENDDDSYEVITDPNLFQNNDHSKP